MPFCINCGANIDGKFCGRCGTAVGSEPSSAGSSFGFEPPRPDPNRSQGPITPSAAVIPEESAAALCYMFGILTGVLFLTLEPYSRNRNIRFHAWQSIFLFGGITVLYMFEMMISFLLPGFLTALLWFATALASLGMVGIWLYLMWKAYHNERVVLPIIGDMALRQS